MTELPDQTTRIEERNTAPAAARPARTILPAIVFLVAIVGTLVVTWVLVTMFKHKQDARVPFVRVAEVSEISTDPTPWGRNWPHQYDGWKATAGDKFYGGSSAMPQNKLDAHPWLKRLYAGYAFSIDYREARGHAYMLQDQQVTKRVTERQQAGACIHCHASVGVMYRKAGLEAMGEDASDEALADSLNMDAMIRGFQEVSRKPYEEVFAMLVESPDGTPDDSGETTIDSAAGHASIGGAHPVSCIDCHDPDSLALRVTRPGFMLGVAALAESDQPLPFLPSIEAWRRGNRSDPYDPNALASRAEMRVFACAQCHVEYYCADKDTLEFPWAQGVSADQIEAHWDAKRFPNGEQFYDYTHGETGAKVLKAQHPEFELWTQGVHARNGVSCADCHMPYERQGAMKVSSHNVRSPLKNINNSCQQCHNVSEDQLLEQVRTIQNRTSAGIERAAQAMTEMLDAILEAKAAGATDAELAPIYELQRKAMWRLDFISSENSLGFHADQEAMRVLAESIDYSRQAQAMALRLRAPDSPDTSDLPRTPVQGVTPSGAE